MTHSTKIPGRWGFPQPVLLTTLRVSFEKRQRENESNNCRDEKKEKRIFYSNREKLVLIVLYVRCSVYVYEFLNALAFGYEFRFFEMLL